MNKRSVVSAGILALSVLMIGIGVANKEHLDCLLYTSDAADDR